MKPQALSSFHNSACLVPREEKLTVRVKGETGDVTVVAGQLLQQQLLATTAIGNNNWQQQQLAKVTTSNNSN